MKRNTTRLFSGLTIVICLIFAFALSVSAQTGLSEDQVKIGETVNVSLDVPSGARVSAWSCTPYGALSFSATTNTGTTYKTVATAVKPGEITVRATVKYADNTTSTVTVGTLLTVLEDGIYTVGNQYADDNYSQSGAFYLRSQITYPTSSGLLVAQHSQNFFGNMDNQIYSHWRISHLGNGEYLILASTERKALSYSSGTVSLVAVEETIPTSARWIIQGNNIKPKSDTSKCLILASPTPSGELYGDGLYYYYFGLTVTTIGDMAIEKWTFEASTGIFIENNSTKDLSAVASGILQFGCNNFCLNGGDYNVIAIDNGVSKTVRWKSSDASVLATDDNGCIRVLAGGKADVIAYFIASDNMTYEIRFTFTVESDHGITNNADYYIMNYNSKRYISLESLQNSNYTNVSTKTRSTAVESQWRVVKQNGLKYKLINKYSSTSKVMDVTGTNIDIYTDTNAAYQKFEIVRLQSGQYVGLYCIRYGTKYVAEDSNNNVYLTTTFSKKAVWSFMKVDKGNVEKYGVNNGDNSATNDQFYYKFNDIGFSSTCFVNQSAEFAYERLDDMDILIIISHGNAGKICFYTDTGGHNGYIVAHSDLNVPNKTCWFINELPNNSLSNLRCVFLIGCYTGEYNGEYNLVNEFYNKGAHFVLGATTKITSQASKWFENELLASLSLPEDQYEYVENNERLIGEIKSINDRIKYINRKSDFEVVVKENGRDIEKTIPDFPSYTLGDGHQTIK